MTVHILDTSTADDDERPDLIDAAWRRHRLECPDCECIGKFRTTTITNTNVIEGPDGGPIGITTTRTPMLSATFTRPTRKDPT